MAIGGSWRSISLLTLALLLLVLGVVAIAGPRLSVLVDDFSQNRSARVVVDRGSLILAGALTEQTLFEVRQHDLGEIEELHISSVRSEGDSAIELAELVQRFGWRVAVNGPCLGGCAQYVFVAGVERIIDANGIVGCGANILAGSHIDDAIYGMRGASAPSRVERARRVYRRAGVSEGYALDCLNGVIPLCYGTVEVDGDTVAAVYTSREAWVPLAADFQRYGMRVVGAPANDLTVSRNSYLRLRRGWGAGPGLPPDWSTGPGLPYEFLQREIPALQVSCWRPSASGLKALQ